MLHEGFPLRCGSSYYLLQQELYAVIILGMKQHNFLFNVRRCTLPIGCFDFGVPSMGGIEKAKALASSISHIQVFNNSFTLAR